MKAVIKKVIVFALAFSLTPMTFAQLNRIISICIDEPIFPPIHIPVGCEVIDCCPGCPGPPIDWNIRVIGESPVEINFRVENINTEDFQRLKMTGNGKLLENKALNIGKGETTISGFQRDGKNGPPVIIPEIKLDEKTAKQWKERLSSEPFQADKDLGSIEISIEQMLGKYRVNQYQFRYIFRLCLWPPPKILTDKIILKNNTSNDQAVVLLDGQRAAGCIDDEVRRGSSTIGLGNVLTNGGCNSEVAVFSDDNAMEFISPVNAWTNTLGDILTVNMRPMLQVPVSVWLRMGDAATLARAQADIANANLLYNTNNAGISFIATYNDVSANANAANVITTAFSCLPAEITALTGSAFFTANQLNVYYVNRAFTGFNCIAVSNIVFIGTTSNNQSLAHEFGHSFSLAHTNGLAGFSLQNLMIGGGAGRTNITDGQCFRCNVNGTSTLNTNGVRTGITRTCPDGTTSALCPALTLNNIPK